MWGWLSQYGHSVFIVSTIVAAIFGGIGIGAAFISAIVGYQLTEVALGEANERIAVADARGEEAKAQVEKAQADIAKANAEIAEARKQTTTLERETADAKERTAFLEKEAAQARAEQERLKSLVIWRSLSPDAMGRLVSSLSSVPVSGYVIVAHEERDPEAQYFASLIGRALKLANWQAFPQSISSGALYFGVFIPGPENQTVKALRQAFTNANIEFSPESFIPPGGSIFSRGGIRVPGGGVPPPPEATIFVASRPPPFR